MMTLESIMKMPTVLNNTHESTYRSYHILEYVMLMVNRGDSKDAINETVELLKKVDLPKDQFIEP